jgi:hypothetical protein
MSKDKQIVLCKLAAIALFLGMLTAFALGGTVWLGLTLLVMEWLFIARVSVLEESSKRDVR